MSALNTICRNIEKVKESTSIKIRLSDLKGKGIDRAKIYLDKIGNYPKSLFENTNWQQIRMLQNIRNTFVHNEGRQIKRYIRANPDFFFKPLDILPEILIKRKYCLSSLENIKEFLSQLLTEYGFYKDR